MKRENTKNAVKITVVGKSNVGKSCLAYRYIHDYFDPKQESTIGAAYISKILDNGVKLQIWDTAGMEKFQSIVPLYLRDSKIILVCFSSSNIEEVKLQIENVRKHTDGEIILVRTKSDLNFLYDSEYKPIYEYALENNYPYFSTSSKTGENVKELFIQVATLASSIVNKDVNDTIKEEIIIQEPSCCCIC